MQRFLVVERRSGLRKNLRMAGGAVAVHAVIVLLMRKVDVPVRRLDQNGFRRVIGIAGRIVGGRLGLLLRRGFGLDRGFLASGHRQRGQNHYGKESHFLFSVMRVGTSPVLPALYFLRAYNPGGRYSTWPYATF